MEKEVVVKAAVKVRGVNGDKWRTLKRTTQYVKSAITLDGEMCEFVRIKQGAVPLGFALSPTQF